MNLDIPRSVGRFDVEFQDDGTQFLVLRVSDAMKSWLAHHGYQPSDVVLHFDALRDYALQMTCTPELAILFRLTWDEEKGK